MLPFHDALYPGRLRDTMTGMEGGSYTAEEAEAILAEVRNIENLLRAGRKEKQQLHHSLKLLGEDLSALVEDGVEGDAAVERHSIASQTDFGADVSGADRCKIVDCKSMFSFAKC